MLGQGCAVLLVLVISDRSAVCRPLPLFFVDGVVTMHCRLFSLTLVTCQLRRGSHSKNCVILKKGRPEKNLFSVAENITARFENIAHRRQTSITGRRKQSNLLRPTVRRERGRGTARINKPSGAG